MSKTAIETFALALTTGSGTSEFNQCVIAPRRTACGDTDEGHANA
jgi:hypothetical protein